MNNTTTTVVVNVTVGAVEAASIMAQAMKGGVTSVTTYLAYRKQEVASRGTFGYLFLFLCR